MKHDENALETRANVNNVIDPGGFTPMLLALHVKDIPIIHTVLNWDPDLTYVAPNGLRTIDLAAFDPDIERELKRRILVVSSQ